MNQLENTPENKAAFFALYYQQEVFSWKDNINSPTALEGCLLDMVRGGNFDDSLLELRSIDILTDEELIFCFDMLFPNSGYTNEVKIDLVKDWCRLINKETGGYLPKNYATFIDYLRKRSVFIPCMGESDKLIEWGWVKIKANN